MCDDAEGTMCTCLTMTITDCRVGKTQVQPKLPGWFRGKGAGFSFEWWDGGDTVLKRSPPIQDLVPPQNCSILYSNYTLKVKIKQ